VERGELVVVRIDWAGGVGTLREIGVVTGEVLERELDALECEPCGELTIETRDEHRWFTAAGSGGVFWVAAGAPGGEELVLVGDASAAGAATIVVGGDDTRVPARHLVTKEAALAAALAFMTHGVPDPHQIWE
jgi:hypothetical protein